MRMLLATLVLSSCQPAKRTEPRTVVIPYDCFCAKGQSDAALLYAAVDRQDRATVYGLIERGKAFQLAKGTRVHTVGSSGGLTMIGLESGRFAGESCWLPDRIVK